MIDDWYTEINKVKESLVRHGLKKGKTIGDVNRKNNKDSDDDSA